MEDVYSGLQLNLLDRLKFILSNSHVIVQYVENRHIDGLWGIGDIRAAVA